mmetsp:Transcript_115593/g.331883  ORF Transcript_115593/g.331883 Transcript_115593/m.331883 type:complete len:243 (-) Transcript_115593:370-1098(-)
MQLGKLFIFVWRNPHATQGVRAHGTQRLSSNLHGLAGEDPAHRWSQRLRRGTCGRRWRRRALVTRSLGSWRRLGGIGRAAASAHRCLAAGVHRHTGHRLTHAHLHLHHHGLQPSGFPCVRLGRLAHHLLENRGMLLRCCRRGCVRGSGHALHVGNHAGRQERHGKLLWLICGPGLIEHLLHLLLLLMELLLFRLLLLALLLQLLLRPMVGLKSRPGSRIPHHLPLLSLRDCVRNGSRTQLFF